MLLARFTIGLLSRAQGLHVFRLRQAPIATNEIGLMNMGLMNMTFVRLELAKRKCIHMGVHPK